jgi:general secretion pathway protein M
MTHLLQQRWSGLSNRERIAVIGLGILVPGALFFVLVVDPLLERIDLLDRQIAVKQRAIGQLAVVGADYAVARAQQAQFDQRIMDPHGTFSLLSSLEEAASAVEIRDRITAMQPHASISSHGYRETSAELRLEGVPFPQLLMLLVKLEDSPHVLHIKRLHAKPRIDVPHRFDASLMVSAYDKE